MGRDGEGSAVYYMQLAIPKVVAIAVSTVITMLRILPQVELLLNVPIVVRTHRPPLPFGHLPLYGEKGWRGVCATRGVKWDFVKGLID